MIKRILESQDYLLDSTYAKHYSHSIKRYIGHFKYLHIHNGSKTVAMDTLDYTGHISTTIGSNDMIEEPLESQDQLLYLTSPTLSIILTLSSTTSQPLQNCQTLQRFLSPLYIGEIGEQYRYRLRRDRKIAEVEADKPAETAYAASKSTLINRVGKPIINQPQNHNQQRLRCSHCGRNNHKAEDCYHAYKPKCTVCKKLGHKEDQCRYKRKNQQPRKSKDKKIAESSAPKVQSNVAEIRSDDETLAAIGEEVYPSTDDPLIDNIYDYNVQYGNTENPNACMYEWLADTSSTHHISNQREIFSSYEPTPEATVLGVGGKVIRVQGQGTLTLTAQYGTRKRTLHLEKINYIPTNKYNILSLGRWDSQGRRYQASHGELILYDHHDVPVLKGLKIASNIYKFILKPYDASQITKQIYSFSSKEIKQTWETWHRRFGHVSYKGLKTLNNENLLDGFTVDPQTPTPDCPSCTEAKQSVKPFGPKTDNTRKNKGELTHMDLWGKYDIASINGHQYYLLLVYDATRYVTVYFLKGKTDAVQHIKNYLTHMHVRGNTTHAIRVDRGTEFINKDLQDWCHTKGMEIEMTSPYSPSQNGVAERMNRTLVELARAMLTSSKLPEFLWEPAVAHATYLRNHAYMTAVKNQTPYQGWFDKKPNVSHLREFGAPVWILHTGAPNSRRCETLGFLS